LIVERNRLAGGVIPSEWLVHQTVTDALPSSESRSFGNDLVAQKSHLKIVSVQMIRRPCHEAETKARTPSNGVGESAAIHAPNAGIRERACGERRPNLLRVRSLVLRALIFCIYFGGVAEGEGFEPPEPFPAQRFSRPPH
jgi:hypothetical protein